MKRCRRRVASLSQVDRNATVVQTTAHYKGIRQKRIFERSPHQIVSLDLQVTTLVATPITSVQEIEAGSKNSLRTKRVQ